MLMVVSAVAVAAFIAVSAMFLIWWERKVSAHIQTRLGPMRTGWHGILQSIADALKLLMKENIVPSNVDRWVYWFAPIVVFAPAFAAYVCIPFGRGLIARDLNVGLLYMLSVMSLGVIGIFMAGWGSCNKYSLLGAMRTVAQILSYEVPLLLSLIGVVMAVGSLSMVSIVEAQKNMWFVFTPFGFIGFIVFLISATAEVNRTPFDIPEAESELVAGFHTEYSGMKFAMFFVAEYTNLFTVCALASTLFLGGWQGPFLPSWCWFLIKSYGLIFLLMWFRWTFPRVRVDQMMVFGWKILVPLGFLDVAGWGIYLLLRS
jgi:NADH-quinone oxidoreductase subunit H